MSPPKFAYWIDVRGIGQPVRFLLEYVGIKYDEVKYYHDKMDDWMVRDKLKLGLDYPNLPYYLDGDVTLTGSLPIMKYVARKYGKNLFGKTDEETAKIEMMEFTVYEFYWTNFINHVIFNSTGYVSVLAKSKEDFISKDLPDKLKQFSTFLGNKKFCVGEEIKYVDFYFYEALRTFSKFAPQVFGQFENLGQYLKRFEALPQIANYMKSSRYVKGPNFPAPWAVWTGDE